MVARFAALAVAGFLSAGPVTKAVAQERLKVVASFSILADLTRNVGGDRIDVTALVGANADAHVYTPSPADAKTVAAAGAIIVNGLGFEGWMTRLIDAAGSKAPIVVASTGVATLTTNRGHARNVDPHAWQSVANARIYVANIRDGLARADPAGAPTYQANAAAYLAKFDALDDAIKAAIAATPPAHRTIITSHNAFAYFGAAYGVRFIAPEGVSTESEASAQAMAAIITQARQQGIRTLFIENVADPRLLQQIARESGATVGGTVYSDALSDASGPASTYIDLMRANLRQFVRALRR